ncbi:MAG: fibrillarin-like rRNA/tRNA 2'-O-methyltransferase [Candidatus Asgardarchaeia archaeon]
MIISANLYEIRKLELSNTYWILSEAQKYLATKNIFVGNVVYGERLLKIENYEYRTWDPFRSKLAAAIYKGFNRPLIKDGDRVLYLGAASGTTASHVSDVVNLNGIVYCIEFSARALRELLNVTRIRYNMIPILADARFPESYRYFVSEVDVIYQDVAQPNQAEILVNNAKFYLKRNGYIFLAIKARSIDVTKSPREIFKKEIETLEQNGFKIIDTILLDPYDKDHAMVIAQLED